MSSGAPRDGAAAALAASLRNPRLLASTPDDAVAALLELAEPHGVEGLLLHRAADAGVSLDGAWGPLRQRCARQMVACELRDEEARRVMARAPRAAIPFIVLKGLALAYTAYPHPWLRPRSDTDILVRPDDVPRLDEFFRASGYQLVPHVRGDLTLPQRHYVRRDSRGFCHAWDVHWRLTASQALGGVLDEDGAWDRAGAGSWEGSLVLSRPDALFLACIHRLAHHFDDHRLIWLWDIRLLLEAMDRAEVDVFAAAASHPRAAAACGRSLSVARDLAGAYVPPSLEPLIERSKTSDPAAFLWGGSRRRITYLVGELRASPWHRRARLLRERALPSPASMRERYPAVPHPLIALMYPVRLLAGIPKWFAAR